MAPKKIYTKKNPDPNPILELVEDPKKLLRKKKAHNGTGISLNRSVSFPKEGVISVEDLKFVVKFELSLFKYELELDLSHTIFDIEKFKTLVPTTSFVPITSPQFSKQEREEFWNTLTNRLKE